MTPQPQREHELFVSERPVLSSQARERAYARRRVITISVLVFAIAGVAYGLWSHRSTNPAEIPTIKGEAINKQKPTDPGGIDIPHQDVEVYNQLEGKNAPQPQVEHLLPLPETPQEAPAPAPPTAAPSLAPPAMPAPAPMPAIATSPIPVTLPPVAQAKPADPLLDVTAPKPIATTVTPAIAPAPAAALPPAVTAAPPKPVAVVPKPASSTITQVLKDTQALSASQPAPAAAAAPPPALAAGNVAVQLASVSDAASAQKMLNSLQQKYADDLQGVSLHLARADLGSRGVFYRIQSQPMAEDTANGICSSLKQKNAGCILVRK